MDWLITQWVNYASPDTNTSHTRLIDAFVDDTSLIYYRDQGTSKTHTEMLETLEHIASTWERLLFFSGSSLNLSKCAWHTTFWEWKFGHPIIRAPKSIQITPSSWHPTTTIRQNVQDTGCNIITIRRLSNPNSTINSQDQFVRSHHQVAATELQRHFDIHKDYLHASDELCTTLQLVQSKLLLAALQKYGLLSKTQTLRHGPLDMGGSWHARLKNQNRHRPIEAPPQRGSRKHRSSWKNDSDQPQIHTNWVGHLATVTSKGTPRNLSSSIHHSDMAYVNAPVFVPTQTWL